MGRVASSLDWLTLLFFQAFLGAGFHILARAGIYQGWRALRELAALPSEDQVDTDKVEQLLKEQPEVEPEERMRTLVRLAILLKDEARFRGIGLLIPPCWSRTGQRAHPFPPHIEALLLEIDALGRRQGRRPLGENWPFSPREFDWEKGIGLDEAERRHPCNTVRAAT